MKYIVITPAKNEEKNIVNTLASLCAQTTKPLQWLILNDNSSDKTAQIVQSYSKQEPWINLINVDTFATEEYSARVVHLFRLGLKEIKTNYDVVVKLDADVSFEKDFCENILREFAKQFFHLKFWLSR